MATEEVKKKIVFNDEKRTFACFSPVFNSFLFIKLFALICGVVWTWVLLISKPLIPIFFFRSHFADITTWNNREIIAER